MDDAELLRAYEARVAQLTFRKYRPFGHPDTLCPDGIQWKLNQKEKGWVAWSNKPWQLDFHNSPAKEKANICANGVGKSFSTLWETTAHLTGNYPDWYTGHRFDKPVKWWVGAIDAGLQTEGVQQILFGANLESAIGTGLIPKDKIVGKPSFRQSGIPNTIHQVMIQHKSGGYSTLIFKTYAQGWKSWQSAAPDGITLDEQPDDNDNKQKGIFEECQTRLFRSSGVMLVGMTPLLGETELTRYFMAGGKGIFCNSATWDDAPHLKEEDKERLRKAYPGHSTQTRTMGVPMMGEGRVINAEEDEIKIRQFETPRHFARIIGMDFGVGVGHPTAAAQLVWDRDKDIVYLIADYRKENKDAIIHAAAIKSWGAWIPVAWPHDGHKTSDLTREKSDGDQVKDVYRNHGLNMLGMSARYDKDRGGSQPQEPIIEELNTRIELGKFFVTENCHNFLEEIRSFHRKDGKIINRREDTIKAVLYALMMLRYAHAEPRPMHHKIHSRTLNINYG